MKDVTLKEFIEIAKDSEELKNRIAECVKTVRGGVSDELLKIASGAGYNITSTKIAGLASLKGGHALHDEAIGSVYGGVNETDTPDSDGTGIDQTPSLEPLVPIEDICEAVIGFFGFDTSDC